MPPYEVTRVEAAACPAGVNRRTQRLLELINIYTTRLLAPPYLYPVLGCGPSPEDMAHDLPRVLVHHILPASTFFSLEVSNQFSGPVVDVKSHGVDPLVIHEAALILRDASKLVEQPVGIDLLYGELFRETVVLGDESLADGELVLVKHWHHGILDNPPLVLGSRALRVDYCARVSLSQAHQLRHSGHQVAKVPLNGHNVECGNHWSDH